MTATATIEQMRAPAVREASMPVVRAGFFDLQGFELLQRVAKAFATSNLVPQQYQGNVANCMIALNLASRLKADELMVMQNLYVVHGRPGWSAKFLIATFNHCGRFSALKYEWIGKQGSDDWGCRAWAIENATGEKIVGPDITIKMAKSEGWYEKKGSKWQTIPQLMLMYRSAAWMINTAAPEISMGLPTAEELADTIDMRPDGSYTVSVEGLRAAASPAQPADIIERESAQPASPEGEKAEVQGTDAPVGEPEQDDGGAVGSGGPTFQDVNRELLQASSLEDLDYARSLIKQLPDETQKATLNQVAARRMRELAPPDEPAAQPTRRARAPINAD
ncbi:hypothetical protein [Cupriavidus alkaliphilus]|uniref:hypothetical protein n=1 Tax=Cupriavidus alkaliphilus TaxID=942866 RepID=UPI00161FD03A|nr:hypothetical protein [Cupriavidus alkaliphilus]MBB2918296.1 hypothetical protein [Cupriavidus alkaliphilus]